MARNKRLRVAFCHPDLGLGGAERLVVDAACELCNHGHRVHASLPTCPGLHAWQHVAATECPVAENSALGLLQVDVYTAYFDRNRCFNETLTGQFSVTVAGGWFPRTIGNRAHAFCAYVRCMLIAVWIATAALW